MPQQILDHFEDCAEIVQSLELDPEQLDRIRAAAPGEFTPVGIGHIAVLEHDAALGVKKQDQGRTARERVAREIVTMGKLLAVRPDLADKAPLFSALLLGPGGHEEGILTEDLGAGSSSPLQEEFFGIPIMGPPETPTPLHAAVREAFGSNNIHREAFGRMTAVTTGWGPRQVLVDYADVLRRDQDREMIGTVMERLEEVSIQL